MSNRLFEISQNMVQKTDDSGQEDARKKVLLDELKKIYGEQAEGRYAVLSSFFDRVDVNYQEIIEGKEKGRSTQSWLKGQLAEKEKNYPDLTEGIMKGFVGLSTEDVENVSAMLDVKNDFDFGIITHHVKQDIEIGSLSQAISLNATMEKAIENAIPQGVRRFTDALKSNLNSQEDREMKEIFTISALRFREESDESSIFRKLNDTQTASIVDTAYTSVKVAFKVADKSMTSEEAVDFLVDRGVARFESLVHSTCTELGGKVGAGIGRVIGGVFGPAGMVLGDKIGDAVGKMAGKKVGDFIVEGTKKVSVVAKEVIRNFASSAKQKFRDGIANFKARFF